MDKLLSMKVFKEIIDTGSFVAAAEKLDISKAMTSNYIKFLEDDLGVRLLNRTSRRISLTNEGKIYYDRCSEILNEVEETEASLKSSTLIPTGILKVAVPTWFQFKHFTEGIRKYLEKYPGVTIEFSLNDRLVDLVEEGIDIGLRVTPELNSNLLARRICQVNFSLYGSKDYLKRMGRPEIPEDLKNHKFVKHTGATLKDSFLLRVGDSNVNIEFKQIVSTNSSLQVAHFAAAGIGLAIIPEYIVNDDSLKNDLEKVLPDYPIDADIYFYAVYSTRRYLSPKVRTFIDFMVDLFKKQ